MTDQGFGLKEHKHNLIINTIHEGFWGFGIAFHSTYAVVPLFLKLLDAPPIIIGSAAGVFTACAALPQITMAFIGQRIQNVKKGIVLAHSVMIPPMLLAGFIFGILAPTGPNVWAIYFGCFVLFSLGVGVVFPIWADFLELVHLPERRGEFFGISFAITNAAGFLGGFAVKKLLKSVPFPSNFGYGFLIYSVCIMAAVVLFVGYRLKPKKNKKPNRDFRLFRNQLQFVLKTDDNYRRYLFSRILLAANYPAISLYAVYAHEKLQFDVSEAGIFTAITVLLSGLSSFIMGKIGDKWGHKHALVFVFIGYLAALVTALNTKTMMNTYLIFVFLGIGQGGFLTTAMSLIFEFAGDEGDKKIYFALTDSLTAPFVVIFIILSGIFIPSHGIATVLVGLGFFILLGILSLAFFTKEPKTARTEFAPPEMVM